MDQRLLETVRERLRRLTGVGLAAAGLEHEAVALAGELLGLARSEQRPAEATAEARLGRLMSDEAGRQLTLAFTDQALRAKRPERVADQLRYLLRHHGIPRYFSAWERAQLRAFQAFGGLFPRWLVPKVLARLRAEVRQVSLPPADPALGEAIAQRAALGIRVNLNHLGEAILGEDEARARHAVYLATLQRPDIEAVSIKVSSIASQIDLLAWDETLHVLAARVGELYRTAMRFPILDAATGIARPKLVTLDMEEYRDLELTTALFERLLSQDEFRSARAGIVLQAYLPDSHVVQQRLVELAQRRVATGAEPIHIRLVKGANLAMERVDASLHGWALAPYHDKRLVDTNYKRLVHFGMQHAAVAHIGIGSHNLFDVAWAIVLRAAVARPDGVGFEMLEGIAGPLARVVQAVTGALMVYAPTADDRDLLSAIAYLIRRLDENTGPDNFLRASFGMTADSPAFEVERARFLAAVREREHAPVGAQRRPSEPRPEALPSAPTFINEPDSDWSLHQNRARIGAAVALRMRSEPTSVRAQIAGDRVDGDRTGAWADGVDPSRPGLVPYRITLVSPEGAEAAVRAARAAAASWSARAVSDRQSVLLRCADALRQARAELIALMVSDAGKAVPEGDAEVSEAIDFASYYALGLDAWATLTALSIEPLGVVLVTPPWNFPLAIPAGGVFAALAAGNAVILKPAPETPRIAEALCELCWEAGVPREVLQLVPCANDPVGTLLVTHPGVDAVVLTGSTATARRFLEMREDLFLVAETGGKNAMIVTELADHDLAVKHVLHSAFGHSGQKCSATSLLIVEAALYDDEGFMRRLADAVRSLPVGSAWEPGVKLTPLIREPRGELAWALNGGLEPGESWLVTPRSVDGNARLWSPGMKLGVAVGSRTYTSELFGPVLAVMRARDLDDALRIANGVAYGLTAGLQSLDAREIAHWKDAMNAGCLYVNRATTGAIVSRQPFGGRKASVFGPGAKAGGPNYVLQLTRARDSADAGTPDYAQAFDAHFARPVDAVRLIGQDNFLRYQPLTALLVRLGPGATHDDAQRAVAAAATCRTPILLSACEGLVAEPWLASLGARVESPEAMFARAGEAERVRVIGAVEAAVRRESRARGLHVASAPVVACGRIELLHYLKEQTISEDYHRFGNLGPREAETRSSGAVRGSPP